MNEEKLTGGGKNSCTLSEITLNKSDGNSSLALDNDGEIRMFLLSEDYTKQIIEAIKEIALQVELRADSKNCRMNALTVTVSVNVEKWDTDEEA